MTAASGPIAEAVAAAIPVRNLRFEFPEDLPRHWCPSDPEFSQIANAFMQALPYLEPYFIYNIREANAQIHDARLRAEVLAYIGQEARHAQEHKRFNLLLRRSYPGLLAFENRIRDRLERSRRQHSLAYRMAYTAGFEAITHRMACFLLNHKQRWLASADARVFGMLAWHMVEEVEHKTVAFDVLQHIHGGLALRVRGLLAATRCTLSDIVHMVSYMLEVDGLASDPNSRRRLRAVSLALLSEFLPGYCQYVLPWHHPSQLADPALSSEWRARYENGRDLRHLCPTEFNVSVLDA